MRVLFTGTAAPSAADASAAGGGPDACVVVAEDDGTKFGRARAKAAKRAAKLAQQHAQEEDDGGASPLPPDAEAATEAAATEVAAEAKETALRDPRSPDSRWRANVAASVGEAGGETGGDGDDEDEDEEPEEEDGEDDEDEDEDEEDSEADGEEGRRMSGFEERSLELETTLSGRTAPFVRLLIIGGPFRGKEFDVNEGGATIGSALTSDIALTKDLSVSALHARVCLGPPGAAAKEALRPAPRWHLVDCASGTGSWQLVPDAGVDVHVGDVFRIARTEVRLLAKMGR